MTAYCARNTGMAWPHMSMHKAACTFKSAVWRTAWVQYAISVSLSTLFVCSCFPILCCSDTMLAGFRCCTGLQLKWLLQRIAVQIGWDVRLLYSSCGPIFCGCNKAECTHACWGAGPHSKTQETRPRHLCLASSYAKPTIQCTAWAAPWLIGRSQKSECATLQR